MSVPIGYEEIKALAEQTGSNINDLIALARSNDPFFIGTPAHIRDAEWFAGRYIRRHNLRHELIVDGSKVNAHLVGKAKVLPPRDKVKQVVMGWASD